jgi:hypothetical protein
MQDSALAKSSGQPDWDDALTFEDFRRVITALSAVRPFSKTLCEEAWLLLWTTFPQHAKRHVTPAMLAYAAGQWMMDPAPAKEVPVHLQLLRYLYRMGNGMPNYQWGLKEDLAQRMAVSDLFNPDPRSLADLIAVEGVPALDGSRHEPAGVLNDVMLFS